MSTDSSELTFVRCPSCRSLVPAASSRCKMCGASLDASAQADQSEEERKKSGRVRQHTTTQASLEAAAPPEPPKEAAPVAEDLDDDPFDIFDMDDDDFDDMKGDDDDSDEGDVPPPVAEPVEAKPEASDASEADENPLSSFLPEDDEDVPVPPVSKPKEPMSSRFDAAESKERSFKPLASTPPPAPSARAEEREPVKPRVSIESGGRPQGKPSSLSFSKQKSEASSAEAPPVAEKPAADRNVQVKVPPIESKRSANGQAQEPSPVNRGPAVNNSGDTRKMLSEKNKLFGWLVSYEKSEGSAIELREGRFFISGGQLKPNDLVIPNKGLSTPHVLASVSANGGLKVQDLMSDSGLFVRKGSGGSYSKEETSVQLEHGDWIKFGDVEFLIALISNGK